MSNEIRKNSLIDTQIHMIFILAFTTIFVLAITIFTSNTMSISIATIIYIMFIANIPFLSFIVEICRDKGWILSIIGIGNDHVLTEHKRKSLGLSEGCLGCLAIVLMK